MLVQLAVLGAFLTLPLSVHADEPKAIIEKAVRAHGGEARLLKVEFVRTKSKGTIETNGVTVAVVIESVSQLPTRLRTVHEFDIMGQRQSVITVCDSGKAWQMRGSATEDITGARLDEVRQTLHARRIESLLPLVKEAGFELSGVADIDVNGKPAVGVKVATKGLRDCTLYFDKDTGLLVRLTRKTLDLNQQEADTETTYSAWKDFDGLKLPTKLLVQQAGKKLLEAEITECKFPDKVDPGEFLKP